MADIIERIKGALKPPRPETRQEDESSPTSENPAANRIKRSKQFTHQTANLSAQEYAKLRRRNIYHPCHAETTFEEIDNGYSYTLHIAPEYDSRLTKKLGLSQEDQEAITQKILDAMKESLMHDLHYPAKEDDIIISGHTLQFRIYKNKDAFSPEVEYEWAKECKTEDVSHTATFTYETIIENMLKDRYASSFSDIARAAAFSLPNQNIDGVLSTFTLAQHPDELEAIDTHLNKLGFSNCKLLAMGGMATIMDTPGKYVIRAVEKKLEENRPVSPQILQPVDCFETDHFKLEIFPRVNTKDVTREHVRAVELALATGWQNPGSVIHFGDPKPINVGLLPDGTPVALDVGLTTQVDESDHRPIKHDKYSKPAKRAERLEYKKAEMLELSKKYSWLADDDKTWKQHQFYPEILTGLKGTTNAPNSAASVIDAATSERQRLQNSFDQRQPS